LRDSFSTDYPDQEPLSSFQLAKPSSTENINNIMNTTTVIAITTYLIFYLLSTYVIFLEHELTVEAPL